MKMTVVVLVKSVLKNRMGSYTTAPFKDYKKWLRWVYKIDNFMVRFIDRITANVQNTCNLIGWEEYSIDCIELSISILDKKAEAIKKGVFKSFANS